MDLFLFGGAALAAFALAATPVLLWSALKRNSELRGALHNARNRIDALEGRTSRGSRGAWNWSQPAAFSTDAVSFASATPEAGQEREFPSIEEHASNSRSGRSIMPPASGLIAAAAGILAVAPSIAAAVDMLNPLAAALLSLAAGVGALIGAEWLHRTRPKEASRGGLALLTALALFLVVASSWFGATQLGVLPALAAFLLQAACAIAALAYSARFGAWMMGLALAATLIIPAITPLDVAAAPARMGFLAVAFGLLIWLARGSGRLVWCWIAAVGALLWGAVAVLQSRDDIQIAATGAYLAALAIVGLLYCSEAARAPLPWPRPWAMRVRLSEPLLTGGTLALGASVLSILLFAASGAAALWAMTGFIALVAGAAFIAAFAEGVSLFALGATAIASALLAFWPAPAGAPMGIAAAALSLVLAIGGWLGVARAREPTPGALLAAFGPLAAIVAAHARLGPLGGIELWSGGAGTIAALNLLFFFRMRGFTRGAVAATIFLSGSALATAAAIAFAVNAPATLPALALLCSTLAIFDRRFDQRALRFSAGIIAAAALALAVANASSQSVISLAPWLEPAAPAALIAAAMLYASALFLGRDEARKHARSAQILMISAVLASAFAIVMQTRHLTGGSFPGVAETGIYTLVALAAATGLSLHFGAKPRAIAFVTEAGAICCALALVLGANGIVLNPWWGLAPAPARGLPILNELIVAYAAPACALLLYGWLRAQQGLLVRANVAAAIGLFLGFLWLSLELRRLFHPQDMAAGAISPLEGWAMTSLWLAFAGGLAWLGRAQESRSYRLAALVLALAALAKAAIFEAAALDGAARIVALALLAAGAGASIVLYNRVLLPEGRAVPRDPNLIPPQ